MKPLFVALVTFSAALAHAEPPAAPPTPADALAQARARFHEAEQAVAEATLAGARAATALRGCHQNRLQFEFASSVPRLELARRSLEAGRRDAQALRARLEEVREAIDASNRGDGRATYAARLATDYAAPLQDQVVPLLERYARGIAQYSAVFVAYGETCAQTPLSAAAAKAFVAEANAKIDALTQTTTDFATAAAAAKGTAPGAAVARQTGRRR